MEKNHKIEEMEKYFLGLITNLTNIKTEEYFDLYIFLTIQHYLDEEMLSEELEDIDENRQFVSSDKTLNKVKDMNENDYIRYSNNAKHKYTILKTIEPLIKNYCNCFPNYVLQDYFNKSILKYYTLDDSINQSEKREFNRHIIKELRNKFNLNISLEM